MCITAVWFMCGSRRPACPYLTVAYAGCMKDYCTVAEAATLAQTLYILVMAAGKARQTRQTGKLIQAMIVPSALQAQLTLWLTRVVLAQR